MLWQVMGGSSPERASAMARQQGGEAAGCGLGASLDVLICRADWEYHLRAPEVSNLAKHVAKARLHFGCGHSWNSTSHITNLFLKQHPMSCSLIEYLPVFLSLIEFLSCIFVCPISRVGHLFCIVFQYVTFQQ